jgi:alkylhydroperoxidase family enzyme
MNRYPPVPVEQLAQLPNDIRDKLLEVQAKAGFVPNVFLMLARRPEEFRSFVQYHVWSHMAPFCVFTKKTP